MIDAAWYQNEKSLLKNWTPGVRRLVFIIILSKLSDTCCHRRASFSEHHPPRQKAPHEGSADDPGSRAKDGNFPQKPEIKECLVSNLKVIHNLEHCARSLSSRDKRHPKGLDPHFPGFHVFQRHLDNGHEVDLDVHFSPNGRSSRSQSSLREEGLHYPSPHLPQTCPGPTSEEQVFAR